MKPAYELQHVHTKSHGRLHQLCLPFGDELRPGVTTVLDKGGPDMPWLAAWKERVGEEEAERIRLDATDRGTCLHGLIESRLTGEPVIIPDEAYALGVPDRDRIAGMFEKVEPALEDLDEVIGVELPAAWSDHTGSAGIISNGFAGSIDCVAVVQGQLSIVDWKTSAKRKRDDRLGNYRMQVVAYKAAFEATYPEAGPIEACHIVIVPEQGKLQIVSIEEDEFHGLEIDFMERLEAFYSRLGWPPDLQEG